MTTATFDVVVVGGGVTGACVARDAVLRGLSVAILEKGDFCQATSAASSKLIHGGLRYLRNLELSLVRESLRERRIWEVVAPHMVYPLPTMIPAYRRRGSPSKFMLRAGLTLYDLLAFDRNRLADEDKKLPAHKVLDREQALRAEPTLPPEQLNGALVYYDCQMYSPERLCLEHLLDAAERGAQVANYAEVTGFVIEDATVKGVEVIDRRTGERLTVRSSVVVNASGPWADRVLGRLPDVEPSTQLVRSKGIHIITRPLTRDHAIVIEYAGGHFFLLPWRGHCLIGTTDTVFRDDPDAFIVTESDVTGLIETVNAGYPTVGLVRDDVAYFYGGLRPLVETPELGDTYQASRRSEVFDHMDADGLQGLISALGGKWTTSRHLAEQVVDLVGRKLHRKLPPCVTDETPLPGGRMERYALYLDEARNRHADMDREVIDHLVRNYGTMHERVLQHADEDPSLAQRLSPAVPDLAAVITHAVREEMAWTLDDVLFRRTGIGTLGHPGAATIEAVVDRMAPELGWDAEERARQIELAERRYTPAHR